MPAKRTDRFAFTCTAAKSDQFAPRCRAHRAPHAEPSRPARSRGLRDVARFARGACRSLLFALRGAASSAATRRPRSKRSRTAPRKPRWAAATTASRSSRRESAGRIASPTRQIRVGPGATETIRSRTRSGMRTSRALGRFSMASILDAMRRLRRRRALALVFGASPQGTPRPLPRSLGSLVCVAAAGGCASVLGIDFDKVAVPVDASTDGFAPQADGASPAQSGCHPGEKACGGGCVSANDPAFGCGAQGACAPCSVSHATATCSAQGYVRRRTVRARTRQLRQPTRRLRDEPRHGPEPLRPLRCRVPGGPGVRPAGLHDELPEPPNALRSLLRRHEER
jgi:hypothetical protein